MARLVINIVFDEAIGDLAGDDDSIYQGTNAIDWLSDIALTLTEIKPEDRPRVCVVSKWSILSPTRWKHPLMRRRAMRAWLRRKGVSGVDQFEFPLFAPRAHLHIDGVCLQRFFDVSAPRPEWLLGLDPIREGHEWNARGRERDLEIDE